MENIDELKSNISGKPKYTLRSGNLFVSSGGIGSSGQSSWRNDQGVRAFDKN